MDFRFRQHVTLFSGVTLNFGKNGASCFVGLRGTKTPFDEIENDSAAHATALLYKTEVFKNLNMHEFTIETRSFAMKKKANHPHRLSLELRNRRGLLYAKKGRKVRAQKDFNQIIAIDSDYADVRQQLTRLNHI